MFLVEENEINDLTHSSERLFSSSIHKQTKEHWNADDDIMMTSRLIDISPIAFRAKIFEQNSSSLDVLQEDDFDFAVVSRQVGTPLNDIIHVRAAHHEFWNDEQHRQLIWVICKTIVLKSVAKSSSVYLSVAAGFVDFVNKAGTVNRDTSIH